MKSPDDPIDDELRKALKSRFDNFERTPDAALTEKLFRKLSGNNKLIYKGLIGTVLLVAGVTVALLRMSAGRETNFAAATGKTAERPGNAFEATLRATAAARPVSRLLKSPTPLAGLEGAGIPGAVPVKASGPRRRVRGGPTRMIERVKTDNSLGAIWIKDDRLTPENRQYFRGELEKLGMQTVWTEEPDSTFAEPKITERVTVADQDIGVLDHKPLSLPEYEWRADTLITTARLKKLYDFHFRERWGIIAGITPLRTFQILTVRPGNGVVYQNFVLPTKISAETVGYKFSAGVGRKGFQLLLNYGQFMQSYKYEIATDEYVVGPVLSGNYQVVRKGVPQQESSTVRMLGLSIKKHTVRRSSFLRNYYGDVGAEFSRDLTSGRNMAWVNAGFGKELAAGPNSTLIVGPYLEYSFIKLRNAENPFRIQPYQVGLAVGLRLNRK